LPLRDAFAVLFFVSVGMLFDPTTVVREPWPTAATFLRVTVGNPTQASHVGLRRAGQFLTLGFCAITPKE